MSMCENNVKEAQGTGNAEETEQPGASTGALGGSSVEAAPAWASRGCVQQSPRGLDPLRLRLQPSLLRGSRLTAASPSMHTFRGAAAVTSCPGIMQITI